jgi:hypothetical protein
MIGVLKITLAKAGKATFNRRAAMVIIAEDPTQLCVSAPGSESFHPQNFDHDGPFGFFHKMSLAYRR